MNGDKEAVEERLLKLCTDIILILGEAKENQLINDAQFSKHTKLKKEFISYIQSKEKHSNHKV